MINATVNSGDTHRYNRYRGRYWLFEVRGNQKNQNVFFLPSFLWNIGVFFFVTLATWIQKMDRQTEYY